MGDKKKGKGPYFSIQNFNYHNSRYLPRLMLIHVKDNTFSLHGTAKKKKKDNTFSEMPLNADMSFSHNKMTYNQFTCHIRELRYPPQRQCPGKSHSGLQTRQFPRLWVLKTRVNCCNVLSLCQQWKLMNHIWKQK